MHGSLDDFAKSYDSDFPYSLDNSLMLNWYPERILDSACGDTALELGLGHGFSTTIFENRFERLVVVEGSPAIIRRFKNKHKRSKAEIVQSYFEDFETRERFDHVIMGFILEHVDDPSAILKKYRGMLKPGGSLFIAVPNAESLNRRIGFAAGLIDDISALGDADLQLGHRRYFTVDSISATTVEAGYEIIKTEGIFLKPFSTQQLMSLELTGKILEALLKVGTCYPELCAGILIEAVQSS